MTSEEPGLDRRRHGTVGPAATGAWVSSASQQRAMGSRAGRASVFTLTQPALPDLLTAAGTVVAATGDAVALCPNYGRAR